MCRLMVYYGDPLLLSHAVLWPHRSIIRQSYDAKERLQDPSLPAHLGHGNLNADGFGIGWYNDTSIPESVMGGAADDTPCTFKGITPAWNNTNLLELSQVVESKLVFAHVANLFFDSRVDLFTTDQSGYGLPFDSREQLPS